jgi:hypothetical protein
VAVSPSFYPDQVAMDLPGTPVSDGQGGWTDGEPTTVEFRGNLQPLTVRDEVVARQDGANVTHTVFCDADVPAVRGAVVRVAAREFEGVALGVRRSSKPGHHMRITVEERQPS